MAAKGRPSGGVAIVDCVADRSIGAELEQPLDYVPSSALPRAMKGGHASAVVGAATDTSANVLPAARIVKNFVMDFS